MASFHQLQALCRAACFLVLDTAYKSLITILSPGHGSHSPEAFLPMAGNTLQGFQLVPDL